MTPPTDPCTWGPRLEELLGHEDEALREHVAGCPHCTARRRELLDLRKALQSTPTATFSNDAEARLRRRIVGDAQRPAERSRGSWGRTMTAAAAAAAVLAAGLWLARVSPPPETGAHGLHATADALDDARFVHRRDGRDEVVRVTAGTVLLTVSPLATGERMLVVTGDAEVEVRGTVFEVEVRDDALQRVRVVEGVVEVRAGSAPPVVLREAERWVRDASGHTDVTAPTPAPTSPTLVGASLTSPGLGAQAPEPAEVPPADDPRQAPRRPVRSPAQASPSETPHDAAIDPPSADTLALAPDPEPVPPNREPATHASSGVNQPGLGDAPPIDDESVALADDSSRVGDPGERTFANGWDLLRAGDHEAAAAAFEQVTTANPDGALSEDARFWLAVAHHGSGNVASAERALRTFLARHGASPRAGEAAVMLGWIRAEAGEHAEARTLFERGLGDPVERVRASARSGLDALGFVDR